MSNLGIFVASTRPGWAGLAIGQWVGEQARAHGGFNAVELLDLAEIALPLADEPDHPRLGNYILQHAPASQPEDRP
jgi:NAD(P)H-dependent FMN reductase